MKCPLPAILSLALSCLLWNGPVAAEDAPDNSIEAGDYKLAAPEAWKREKPRNRIIEQEFSVPAAEGDETPGRITMMFSGGSLDDNLDRWKGQFKQIDKAKDVEKHKIADLDLHILDITGTFVDKPAPFAPGVDREGYRMLGAIIEMGKSNYFIKFYGPKATVEEHADEFKKLLDSLKKAE
ncbi:MAG: hypothetical protein AB7O62_02495 [Pirellulales bacterium]